MDTKLVMDPPVCVMRDYMNPERITPQSAIVLPARNQLNAFTIKASHLTLMSPFHGRDCDNPLQHVRDFEYPIDSMATPGRLETAHLTLFPHSLKDKAKAWFQSLEPQSLRTWAKLLDAFYAKYFPISKINLLVA